jgi:hypothetical protein
MKRLLILWAACMTFLLGLVQAQVLLLRKDVDALKACRTDPAFFAVVAEAREPGPRHATILAMERIDP